MQVGFRIFIFLISFMHIFKHQKKSNFTSFIRSVQLLLKCLHFFIIYLHMAKARNAVCLTLEFFCLFVSRIPTLDYCTFERCTRSDSCSFRVPSESWMRSNFFAHFYPLTALFCYSLFHVVILLFIYQLFDKLFFVHNTSLL